MQSLLNVVYVDRVFIYRVIIHDFRSLNAGGIVSPVVTNTFRVVVSTIRDKKFKNHLKIDIKDAPTDILEWLA